MRIAIRLTGVVLLGAALLVWCATRPETPRDLEAVSSLSVSAPSSSPGVGSPNPLDRLPAPIAMAADGGGVMRDGNVSAFFHERGVAIGAVRGDRGWGLHWGLAEASAVAPTFEGELPTRLHYFVGAPATWRTDQPAYSGVRWHDARPGVDVSIEHRQHGLKYTVHFDAGVSEARFRYAGAREVRVVEDGSALEIVTDLGTLREDGLVCRQDDRAVRARYAVCAAEEYAIVMEGVDTQRPLTLDPTITWSAFLGGTIADNFVGQPDDEASAVAVDSMSGKVYVTGFTNCGDFPSAGGFDASLGGSQDAFVTQITPAGVLGWSCYIGGANADAGHAIAVDAEGSIYVAGASGGAGFPATLTVGPSNGAFVMKLTLSAVATPNVAWIVDFGGTGADAAYGLAVDAAGGVIVTGETNSTNFPTPNGFDTTSAGYDAFVTKISASGSSLAWSTYLGGTAADLGRGVALDASGNAVIVGYTGASDFPVGGGFDTTYNGGVYDAFVSKIWSDGSGIMWSAYLGGSSSDYAYGVALQGPGHVCITGQTHSVDFPLLGAFDTVLGDSDAFVTKVDASGTSLVWSSYLGGSSSDAGHAIAIDSSGAIFVTGETLSLDFPFVGGFDATRNGMDAFVATVASSGAGVLWSSYLGGNSTDRGNGIALDASGNVYLVGETLSTDFPTLGGFDTSPGVQPGDAYVTKVAAGAGWLTWSSYLGGEHTPGDDYGTAVASDAAGNVYLTGYTYAQDFPSIGGFDTTYGGGGPGYGDAFVTKINAGGASVAWSTYLGGAYEDAGYGVAVDSAGNVLVTGCTHSTDFPTPGGYDTAYGGGTYDAFVTKVSASGSSLVWSTYSGSDGEEVAYGVAADAAGDAYVTGYRRTPMGQYDAFVSRVTAAGALGWYTLVAGTEPDFAFAVTIDSSHVYVGGKTGSGNLTGLVQYSSGTGFVSKISASTGAVVWSSQFTPNVETVRGIGLDPSGNIYVAGDRYVSNQNDVFVEKLAPSGTVLLWSWVASGTFEDRGCGLTVDAAGNAYVSGYTSSANFPTTAGMDTTYGGGAFDGFVAKVNAAGSALLWSTFLGGSGDDRALGVALDGAGRTYAVGHTDSPDFPASGGFDSGLGATVDAFVVAVGNPAPAEPSSLAQYKSDGVTAIAIGEWTPEASVVLAGAVSDPEGDSVRLQVEVRAVGTAFSNVATAQGAPVGSGSTASVSVSGLVSGTAYHWQARTVDAGGTASGWVSFGGNPESAMDFGFVDTSAPTAGTVNDGTAADIDWQSSKTTVNANWTGFADPQSGIAGYQWAIGTSPGASNVRPFTGVGLATSATATGLSLSTGTWYYVSVRATNGAGLTVTASSDGFRVDTSVPNAGTVRDGTGADIDTQTSTTTISANWSGFSDSQSGIAGYEWAIGTTSGGTNVQAFTSVGLATSATNASLTLTAGQKYWVTVRATNGAGLTKTKTSDGVTVNP